MKHSYGTFPMVGIGIALGLTLVGCFSAPQPTAQHRVHDMGSHVMPFDLTQTVHIFKMTDQGGIEQVLTRESGHQDQVVLIRSHLSHEASMFQAGNFSDPMKLHGREMPGVQDLSQGIARVNVSYEDLPQGGQISFLTEDIHLITAVHRWFGAQLSDHGADAQYQ